MSYIRFAPCPKCNRSGGIHVSEWYNDDGGSSYFCVCDNCGYEDPDRFEEEYVAVDHWNRRVSKGYIDEQDLTETDFDDLLTTEADYYRDDNRFDGEDEESAIAASMGMHIVSIDD